MNRPELTQENKQRAIDSINECGGFVLISIDDDNISTDVTNILSGEAAQGICHILDEHPSVRSQVLQILAAKEITRNAEVSENG